MRRRKQSMVLPRWGLVALTALMLALHSLVAPAETETYTLDSHRATPGFAIRLLGIWTVKGRFQQLTGSVSIDRETHSVEIDLLIDTASITTVNDAEEGTLSRARDETLRSADFFNVKRYPRMHFQSTSVRFEGERPVEVIGELTLIGVTRPVNLLLTRWDCTPLMAEGNTPCMGEATTTVRRSDFGMIFGRPAIGNEVHLTIGFAVPR